MTQFFQRPPSRVSQTLAEMIAKRDRAREVAEQRELERQMHIERMKADVVAAYMRQPGSQQRKVVLSALGPVLGPDFNLPEWEPTPEEIFESERHAINLNTIRGQAADDPTAPSRREHLLVGDKDLGTRTEGAALQLGFNGRPAATEAVDIGTGRKPDANTRLRVQNDKEKFMFLAPTQKASIEALTGQRNASAFAANELGLTRRGARQPSNLFAPALIKSMEEDLKKMHAREVTLLGQLQQARARGAAKDAKAIEAEINNLIRPMIHQTVAKRNELLAQQPRPDSSRPGSSWLPLPSVAGAVAPPERGDDDPFNLYSEND
jgi:hypothetical protein